MTKPPKITFIGFDGANVLLTSVICESFNKSTFLIISANSALALETDVSH